MRVYTKTRLRERLRSANKSPNMRFMTADAFDKPIAPPGYRLVPDGPVYTETIAFRVTQEQLILLMALRDTFPEHTHAVALRWLLNQRVVKDLINARIMSADSGSDELAQNSVS